VRRRYVATRHAKQKGLRRLLRDVPVGVERRAETFSECAAMNDEEGLLPPDDWETPEVRLGMQRQALFRGWVDYNPLTGTLLRKKSAWKRNIGQPMTIYTDTRNNIMRQSVSILGTNYHVGNFIWCYVTGYYPDKSEIIYYVNDDHEDRRFCNLRLMKKIDYAHIGNGRIDKNCLGVAPNTLGGTKFRAHIEVNRRHKSLGVYETEQEARVAYLREKQRIRKEIGIKYGIDVNKAVRGRTRPAPNDAAMQTKRDGD
jgi:hypothetical protein